MLTKPEQLLSRLKQQTHALVWISGDEPLLMQEACDGVRQHAREQGFSEREVLDAGANFDWNLLLAANNNLSLFAERKLIDLRLGAGKPDERARETLLAYLDNPNPDNLLLLTCGKLDKAAQGTRWFKSIESKSLFCQVWPVAEQQLPQWIQQRLHRLGLNADAEAVQLLVERVEGNLLAAAQEIDKLRLLVSGDRLEAKTVMAAVADSSRFNVFTLTDACLGGQAARALRILEHLRAEGEEPLWLLNRLCHELRTLSGVLSDLDKGQALPAVLQGRGVWSTRAPLVTSALRRHNHASLQHLLDKARIVDQAVKGLRPQRPWDELADIALGLSNPRLLVGMV